MMGFVEGETDYPWLARRDWASGRIEYAQAWKDAILVSLFTVPFAVAAGAVLVFNWNDPGRPMAIGIAILIVGLGIVFAGARAAQLWWTVLRFGHSALVLDTIPGVVSGHLKGRVEAPLRLREKQAVCVELSCTATYQTSSGHITANEVWRNDRLVSPPEASAAGNVTIVPFDFFIPPGALETGPNEGRASGSWDLRVSLRPWSGYMAMFEVPVFRTAESPEDSGPATGDSQAPIDLDAVIWGVQAQAQPTRPASSRVVMTTTEDGVTFDIGPATWMHVMRVFSWLVIPWFAWTVWAMTHDARLTLEATAAGLPIAAIARWLWHAQPKRVLIGRERIVVIAGNGVTGKRREMPLEEAGRVEVGNRDVCVIRKGASFFNRFFPVSSRFSSQDEARWYAGAVDKAIRSMKGEGALPSGRH